VSTRRIYCNKYVIGDYILLKTRNAGQPISILWDCESLLTYVLFVVDTAVSYVRSFVTEREVVFWVVV
jgi:hypothetical protein